MPTISDRLTQRLQAIKESMGDISWKDPNNANYDRQWAEDALFHTIGPLMDTPRWSETWSSPSSPVPGFVPGGPAPRWTPEEVVFAIAGDPSLAFRPGAKDNPRSPAYGDKGGAPLWRVAKRVARIYNRDRDPSFISDMYSNGFIPLVRMMKPGFDEGRSPFISYVIRNIQGAMEHGVGGTEQGIRAKGGESTSGLSGLESLINTTDPAEARRIANQIKGKYQTGRFHDKHPDNPFGPFSGRVHQVAMMYADALESGNEEAVEKAKNQISQLADDIEGEQTVIPGASTGMGQAISTPDRKTSIGVSSMDLSADEEKGSMAGNIPSYQDDEDDTGINQDTIFYVLDVALAHDLTRWLTEDPNLAAFAAKMGLSEGDTLGRMTVNEMRYLIRSLGPLGTKYPGRGKPRKAVNIPRDAKNWWQPLEDPELEPIPGTEGGLWRSLWTRHGFDEMGPTEIAREMTDEVREFMKLGIPTARVIKQKARVEEVVSKVAVSNALQKALLKLKVILYSQRSSMGLDENVKKELRKNGYPLMEDYDPVDRRIIFETLDWMIRKVSRKIMEDSPPGFSGTVEHMKDEMSDDKAFAIAWSMYKKGAQPHKTPTKKGDKYVPPSERKKSDK